MSPSGGAGGQPSQSGHVQSEQGTETLCGLMAEQTVRRPAMLTSKIFTEDNVFVPGTLVLFLTSTVLTRRDDTP